jgi:hypothetical protein
VDQPGDGVVGGLRKESMQTHFAETKKRGLLTSGLGMIANNKRYIFWFWLLNLTLAEFGTAAFRRSAHAILDHSLYADRLVHGFDLAVYVELLSRPEFGQIDAMRMPALYLSFLFFVITALFLPGVFMGYASTYRLPREEFFRACGRNLWRFIRLMIVAGFVMGIVAAALFGAQAAIVKKAGESTNEILPFELQMAGLFVIFLVMTSLRIWFDLAEAEIVLDDQRAVLRSIAAAFRHTLRGFFRLLATYVFVTIIAAMILLGGLLAWMKLLAPENVVGAFCVGQLTLFFLLTTRFWQRGIAVSYWQQRMLQPVAASEPVAVASAVAALSAAPVAPITTPPAIGEA